MSQWTDDCVGSVRRSAHATRSFRSSVRRAAQPLAPAALAPGVPAGGPHFVALALVRAYPASDPGEGPVMAAVLDARSGLWLGTLQGLALAGADCAAGPELDGAAPRRRSDLRRTDGARPRSPAGRRRAA